MGFEIQPKEEYSVYSSKDNKLIEKVTKEKDKSGEVIRETYIIGTGHNPNKPQNEYTIVTEPTKKVEQSSVKIIEKKPIQNTNEQVRKPIEPPKRTFANWLADKGVSGVIYSNNVAYATEKSNVKGYKSQVLRDESGKATSIEFTKEGEAQKQMQGPSGPNLKPMSYTPQAYGFATGDISFIGGNFTPVSKENTNSMRNFLLSTKPTYYGETSTLGDVSVYPSMDFMGEKTNVKDVQFREFNTYKVKDKEFEQFKTKLSRTGELRALGWQENLALNIQNKDPTGLTRTYAETKAQLAQDPNQFLNLGFFAIETYATLHVGGAVFGLASKSLKSIKTINYLSKTKVAYVFGKTVSSPYFITGLAGGSALYTQYKTGDIYQGLKIAASIPIAFAGFKTGMVRSEKIVYGASVKDIMSSPKDYSYYGKTITKTKNVLGYNERKALVSTKGGTQFVNEGRGSIGTYKYQIPTSRSYIKFAGKNFKGFSQISSKQTYIEYTKTINGQDYVVGRLTKGKYDLYSASLKLKDGGYKPLFDGRYFNQQNPLAFEFVQTGKNTKNIYYSENIPKDSIKPTTAFQLSRTTTTGTSGKSYVKIQQTQILKAQEVGFYVNRNTNLKTLVETGSVNRGKIVFVNDKPKQVLDTFSKTDFEVTKSIKPVYTTQQTTKLDIRFGGYVGKNEYKLTPLKSKTFKNDGLIKYQNWARDWTLKNQVVKTNTYATNTNTQLVTQQKVIPQQTTKVYVKPISTNKPTSVKTYTPNFINIPIKNNAISSLWVVGQSVFSATSQKTLTRQTQTSQFRQTQTPRQIQVPIIKQKQISKQIQIPISKQTQTQKYVVDIKQFIDDKINPPPPDEIPPPPPPPPPNVNFGGFGIPNFSWGGGSSRSQNYAKQKTRANRNYQYTATLKGLFLGLKQKNKNIRFTGLEVRGV